MSNLSRMSDQDAGRRPNLGNSVRGMSFVFTDGSSTDSGKVSIKSVAVRLPSRLWSFLTSDMSSTFFVIHRIRLEDGRKAILLVEPETNQKKQG